MIIKALDNKYVNQITALILPIQQLEFGVNVSLDDQPDLKDIEQYYTSNGGFFGGAFDHEQLIGTIAFLNIGHESVALRKMFVKKEYRGKELGIAKQLLIALELECQRKKIKHIYLGTVDQLKASHRFYEKNGFTQIAKENLPSYFPLMQVDTIFYEKELAQCL